MKNRKRKPALEVAGMLSPQVFKSMWFALDMLRIEIAQIRDKMDLILLDHAADRKAVQPAGPPPSGPPAKPVASQAVKKAAKKTSKKPAAKKKVKKK